MIAWAAEPGRSIGKMTSEKMEDTLFLNLSVRLGQPYCYMHQGDCEHLVVFTDIRLVLITCSCHCHLHSYFPS